MKIEKISVYRKGRAAPVSWELHQGDTSGFFRFGIASRTHHRWWAFTVYVYFTRTKANLNASKATE